MILPLQVGGEPQKPNCELLEVSLTPGSCSCWLSADVQRLSEETGLEGGFGKSR